MCGEAGCVWIALPDSSPSICNDSLRCLDRLDLDSTSLEPTRKVPNERPLVVKTKIIHSIENVWFFLLEPFAVHSNVSSLLLRGGASNRRFSSYILDCYRRCYFEVIWFPVMGPKFVCCYSFYIVLRASDQHCTDPDVQTTMECFQVFAARSASS